MKKRLGNASSFLFYLLTFLFTKCTKSTTQLHLSQKISSDTAAAYEYLDEIQQPTDCKGKNYTIVSTGDGGGFASQFQIIAAQFLRVIAGHGYTVPVIIQGHFKGYTEGIECSHVKSDWTCLFLPVSTCQHEFLKSGTVVPHSVNTKYHVDSSMIPAQFAHKGLAWWWGIIQARLFRVEHTVEKYIREEMRHMKGMNAGRGFPFGAPVAGE